MYRTRGHVAAWPDVDHKPETIYYDGALPEAVVSLAAGWWLHVPATSAGALYLRRLAAVLDTAADQVATIEPRAGAVEPEPDPMAGVAS